MWQLVQRSARILRVQFPSEYFIAYRLPSRTPIPDAQPGTILFDACPDLSAVREMLSEHDDLWDVLRDEYWDAVLHMTELPDSTEL